MLKKCKKDRSFTQFWLVKKKMQLIAHLVRGRFDVITTPPQKSGSSVSIARYISKYSDIPYVKLFGSTEGTRYGIGRKFDTSLLDTGLLYECASKNVLVVDDFFNTGGTFKYCLYKLEMAHVVCISIIAG